MCACFYYSITMAYDFSDNAEVVEMSLAATVADSIITD